MISHTTRLESFNDKSASCSPARRGREQKRGLEAKLALDEVGQPPCIARPNQDLHDNDQALQFHRVHC